MSVRLVVLSDTHMPRRGRELPPKLLTELAGADMIVHLGDFTGMEVVNQLESFAPLVGVSGNNDREEIRTRFAPRRTLLVEGHSLVLIHGDIGGRTARQAALAEQFVDVVLFGHSHVAYNEVVSGRLLFNPGSPTDKRWWPHRSFGILEIGDDIDAKLVLLD